VRKIAYCSLAAVALQGEQRVGLKPMKFRPRIEGRVVSTDSLEWKALWEHFDPDTLELKEIAAYRRKLRESTRSKSQPSPEVPPDLTRHSAGV
jgi:hypothetical protein